MQTIELTDGTRYSVFEIKEGQKMNAAIKQRKNTATFCIKGTGRDVIREKFADPLLTQEIRVFLDTGHEIPGYHGYTLLRGINENFAEEATEVTMMESSTVEDELRENRKALESTQEELNEVKEMLNIIVGGAG